VFLLVATYYFHLDFDNRAQTVMLLKNVGLMGGLMYVWVCGPGRFSVDGG